MLIWWQFNLIGVRSVTWTFKIVACVSTLHSLQEQAGTDNPPCHQWQWQCHPWACQSGWRLYTISSFPKLIWHALIYHRDTEELYFVKYNGSQSLLSDHISASIYRGFLQVSWHINNPYLLSQRSDKFKMYENRNQNRRQYNKWHNLIYLNIL